MSQAQAVRKIVVGGGSGFLGSRICKSAVARGWNVVSISRKGEPDWSTVTASPNRPEWANSVAWESADIFQPATYRKHLEGSEAVVHSMGILLEADYKDIVSGKVPIMTGLKKIFDLYRSGGSTNPLEEEETKKVPLNDHQRAQLTYELMNRDSPILLAKEARQAGVSTFVYISAAAAPPMVPSRYITTKRVAESTISTHFSPLRGVYLRPGLIYDQSRTFTMPLALATRVSATANDLTGGVLSPLMGAGGVKPLAANSVADAAVESIEDLSVKGPIEVGEIENLAQRAWRKNMV